MSNTVHLNLDRTTGNSMEYKVRDCKRQFSLDSSSTLLLQSKVNNQNHTHLFHCKVLNIFLKNIINFGSHILFRLFNGGRVTIEIYKEEF